jgi:hypothetical protein
MVRKKPITLQEHAKSISPLGGKARMESMTAEERRAFAASGGKAGGKARLEKLSAKRRSEIAKAAALARWKKRGT